MAVALSINHTVRAKPNGQLRQLLSGFLYELCTGADKVPVASLPQHRLSPPQLFRLKSDANYADLMMQDRVSVIKEIESWRWKLTNFKALDANIERQREEAQVVAELVIAEVYAFLQKETGHQS